MKVFGEIATKAYQAANPQGDAPADGAGEDGFYDGDVQ